MADINALIISYLLGSIPMGLLLTKMMGKGDLRKVGSGNIGATNVMRVGGLRMAGLVWLLDMAKAIAAVFIGKYIGGESFGAVIVFCLIPIFGFVISSYVGWAFLAIGLLCMWRHRGNIVRLIAGTESKIEWKWKK